MNKDNLIPSLEEFKSLNEGVNSARDKPLQLFVKKMVKLWGVSQGDVVHYIHTNLDKVLESKGVNEARSPESKAAKKAGLSKQQVEEIQLQFDNIELKDIADILATKSGIDAAKILKVIKSYGKINITL